MSDLDLDALERNWRTAKAINMPTKVTAEFPDILLALIQRLREAETALGIADYQIVELNNRNLALERVREAALQLDRWLEVQRAVLPSSRKTADAHDELHIVLGAVEEGDPSKQKTPAPTLGTGVREGEES